MGWPVAASQSRAVLSAPGEHGLAVGAERHGVDPASMRQGWADGPAGRRVPEPRRLVCSR